MIEYENLGKANHPFFEEYTKAFAQVLESGWYLSAFSSRSRPDTRR